MMMRLELSWLIII